MEDEEEAEVAEEEEEEDDEDERAQQSRRSVSSPKTLVRTRPSVPSSPPPIMSRPTVWPCQIHEMMAVTGGWMAP